MSEQNGSNEQEKYPLHQEEKLFKKGNRSFELAREMSLFNDSGFSYTEQKEFDQLEAEYKIGEMKFLSRATFLKEADCFGETNQSRLGYLYNIQSYYRTAFDNLTTSVGVDKDDAYFTHYLNALVNYDPDHSGSDQYLSALGKNTGEYEGLCRAVSDYTFWVNAEVIKKKDSGTFKEGDFKAIQDFKNVRYRRLYLTKQMTPGEGAIGIDDSFLKFQKIMETHRFYIENPDQN